MSRPLFVGSYLQVMCGGLSANEKKEKFALNDNTHWLLTCACFISHGVVT